jgi:uroporphyrinogen-III synthase
MMKDRTSRGASEMAFTVRPGADPHAPLAGATVILTRPVGTAAAMSARARKLGGRSLSLPGLSLRPAASPARARSGLALLAKAEIVIFQSPAAVRFARALRPSLRLRRGAVALAIGEGTLRALARAGIDAIVPERGDSEGVLALAQLGRVRGRRIVLVGAAGGRDLIAPELRRRGARVELAEVYRRTAPRLTKVHFDALAAARDPLVTLVSSGEAMAHLAALLPSTLHAHLQSQMLVVSSARLAGIARRSGFRQVAIARSASPRDLLATAGDALARHRL